MPLPDTATGLDWSHLVDAARAFEGKDAPTPRAPLCAQRACSCGACTAHVYVLDPLANGECFAHL